MKILFAAGGSIGHIAPCVAVWRAVQTINPHAETFFVCSLRQEDAEFLRKEHISFVPLAGRSITLLNILPMAVSAWKILGREKPDVIFTKGGGVTIPLALAGWMRRIPIVAHESDSIPGRATAFISRFAATSLNGFRTGNPLRPGIASGSRERGLALTGFSGDRPILLVMGGSQGAVALNEAVMKNIDALLKIVDIIHLTGEGKGGVQQARTGYWSRPFVHEELPHLYAAADIAVSRAGAGGIGELAANGIASILVPLEGVAHDHQTANASILRDAGACVLLRQHLLATDLVTTVAALAASPERRRQIAQTMQHFANPEAAAAIAKIVIGTAGSHS